MGDPEAGPLPELSAPSAVATQLNALKDNNSPRTNHGLEVMYQFCGDADGMTRSRYYGVSKGALTRHQHMKESRALRQRWRSAFHMTPD